MQDTKKVAPLLANLKPAEQTLPFLEYYQHGCLNVVVFDRRKTVLNRTYEPELVKKNPQSNIYYTLNVVRPDFSRVKPTKKDISELHAWGADVDPHPDYEAEPIEVIFQHYHLRGALKNKDVKWVRQLAYILQEVVHPVMTGKRGLPASLVVFSGRGVQLIWYADKNYKASSKVINDWEGLGRAIISVVGGDAVFNVDRLLRLPGTINTKTEIQARVIRETQASYSPEQILTAFGPVPDKVEDNRKGVDPSEFQYVDWDAVFATNELLDLDDSLIERFQRDLKLSTDLASLYEGQALPDMRDTSGSGFDLNLLGALKRRGYEIQDAFQIAMTYPYGSGHKHADNRNSRHFMRCWARTTETSPQEDFADIPTEEVVDEKIVFTHRTFQKAEDDIRKNYMYVATADKIIHVQSGAYFDTKGFNTKFGTTHTGRRDEPPLAHRVLVAAGRQVDRITWLPGKPKILKKKGITYYNMYHKNACAPVEYTEGCTAPFHKVLNWVIETHQAAEYFWDYCAFTVQHPEIKINHHPLLYSIMEGVGKDTILTAVRYAIGEANSSESTLKDLTGSFNEKLKYKKLIIINEVESFKLGKEIANVLKPLLAAPPETISINAKYQPEFDQPNLFSVIMTSNSTRPLHVAGVDRRVTPIHCREERMPEEMANEIWDWLKSGGLKLLHYELMNRDISHFNPNARPTGEEIMADHAEMQENSRSNSEIIVEEMIASAEGIFDRDVVHFSKMLEFADERRITVATILEALKTAGALKLNRASVKHTDGRVRKHTMWVVRNHSKFGTAEKPGVLTKHRDISAHMLYDVSMGVTDFDDIETDGEDLL